MYKHHKKDAHILKIFQEIGAANKIKEQLGELKLSQ
jgi:hypothetical protein